MKGNRFRKRVLCCTRLALIAVLLAVVAVAFIPEITRAGPDCIQCGACPA